MTPDLRAALVHCRRINGWLSGYPACRTRWDRYKLIFWTRNQLDYLEYQLAWPDYCEAVAFWGSLHTQRKEYTLEKPVRRKRKAA